MLNSEVRSAWMHRLAQVAVTMMAIGFIPEGYCAEAPGARAPSKPLQDNLVSPAAPLLHRRIHYNGDIWMSVANDGSIGTASGGGGTCDPEDQQKLGITYCPSFEIPAASRVDYLFNGSLWIGGLVGSDTLVSVTKTAGSGDAFEFNGFDPIVPGVPVGYPGGGLQQTYTCVYYDTFPHPNAQSHTPLGLEITQVTHQSADNLTRRFIIYDYEFRNISDRPIEKMWFGLFMDNDCFWDRLSGCTESGPSDDIEGCLTTWPNPTNPIYSDSLMVVWAADNDGDACGATRFPTTSARGAMGVRVLRGPIQFPRVNYNWFVTNFGNIDWGPRLASDGYVFPGGGTGLPPGDPASYHTISNGEIDYAQPFAAINYTESDPPWRAPMGGAAGHDIANGLDSRALISSGELPRLDPGQSVPWTIAFIGTNNLHKDPLNTIDPNNPQVFMDKLDFSDLATSAWWAGYIFDNYGVDTDGDGYRGEYYRPVINDDPVYYTGDGIPDFTGPAPPPAPDSANADLRVSSAPGELTVKWSGRTAETWIDKQSRTANFEGYKLYWALRNSRQDQPGSEDYALVAQWDRLDYRRWVYQPSRGAWDVDSDPLTTEQWQVVFKDDDFDPLEHSTPSLETCYPYWEKLTPEDSVERCAYFVPQNANHADEYLDGGVIKENIIRQVAVRDTIIDDSLFHFGEYEARLTGLLPSKHYFISVSTIDFGDPFNDRDPAENRGTAEDAVIGIPIYSADVVEAYIDSGDVKADSVRISVYPNPYKVSFEEGGRRTSYFEKELEGLKGQTVLREEDRRIHFINLPRECVINIYSLDGDLVRTLEHFDENLSGYTSKISWDLISRNQQAVTSGIYLFRVDWDYMREEDQTRVQGSHVGKLVIIK